MTCCGRNREEHEREETVEDGGVKDLQKKCDKREREENKKER
jgi:hypothetical protein